MPFPRFSVFLLSCFAFGFAAAEEDPVTSEAAVFTVETVTSGLEVPWSMSFLPDGSALVVERDAGRLHRLDPGTGQREELAGLPDMLRSGKISAGLFDVRPHPDFSRNRWVYLAYAEGTPEAVSLVVDRMTLEGNRLLDPERLFTATPRTDGKWHFGGRLAVTGGYLYITTGDGYAHSVEAQNLASHMGKILRLRPGDRPAGNAAAWAP